MPNLKAVFTALNQRLDVTLHPLNDSFIVLIPKKELPKTPQDFRPISLVNGIQKIYSKIMADKLRPLLDKLLSPTHTGFMKKRNILHGFHYAQQVIQAAVSQKVQIATFKADIFKAFDTLHWQFIRESLQARNFPLEWIQCVQNKVLTGKSRVILNSVAGKAVRLKRGVRQGVPLSPYLFNLSMDFLARWIQKLNDLNFLATPFPQCKACLLYADDTLLFLKPTREQMIKVKLLLELFGQISGLKINLLKSELSVTAADIRLTQDLAAVLQCKPTQFPFRYLGLPLSDKGLTKADYLPLLEKVQTALNGWTASLLSIGGRLVLTNSVLSSLPQYYMSVFLLPKWLTRQIDQIRRRFLWHGHKGSQGQTKGLYMVNWTLVTRPREIGGLGVRDIRIANQALLMKWMWQWHEHQHAWWKHATRLATQSDRPWEDTRASSFWKSLNSIQPAFDASVQAQIGNGCSTKFWYDNWCGTLMRFLYPNLFQATRQKEASVAQSWQNGHCTLQFSTLNSMAQLQKDQMHQILQNLQITQTQDRLKWLRHSQSFSVKSAYNFLAHRPSPSSLIKNIWLIRAPLRVTVFAWLLLLNRLTTVDNLVKRGWHLTNMCALCKENEESVQHIFQKCPLAREMRDYIYTVFAHVYSISPRYNSELSTLTMMDLAESDRTRQWEITTCFVLWRERCRMVFAEKEKSFLSLVREVQTEWELWFKNTAIAT